MQYFLGKEEINKINVGNFDEIKCIARYSITEEDKRNFSLGTRFTVENNAILCRNVDFFTKFLYLGSLPSESGENLPSSNYTFETTLEKRVHYEVVEDKYTLLYVREISSNKNILFDNGMESLRLNDVIHTIKITELHNNYLVIITERYEMSSGEVIDGFILVKVIPKRDNKFRLVEIFQTNLHDIPSFKLPNLLVDRIIFNSSMNSSKLLLVLKENSNLFIMTFDIKTLRFSALFDLEKCKPFYIFTIFYCYNNLLNDLIILHTCNNVHIIRQSNDDSLYIYKKTLIPIPTGYMVHNISCCNNRNNEVILFVNALIESELDESCIILNLDVLNGKTCQKFHNCNTLIENFDFFNIQLFFNPTGEEIFVKHESLLEIYVYKSNVRSLKQTCQILVLEQYSIEQLNLMNLPKYILFS